MIDLALNVVRIDAINTLISGFLCLVIGLIGVYVIVKRTLPLYKYGMTPDARDLFGYMRPSYVWPLAVSGFLTCVFSIRFFVIFTNVWTWVGLFHPELLVAKQAIIKLLGN